MTRAVAAPTSWKKDSKHTQEKRATTDNKSQVISENEKKCSHEGNELCLHKIREYEFFCANKLGD